MPYSDYELHEQLGAGGMGEVWRGWDMNHQRNVAIKFMCGPQSDSQRVARFNRGVEALAKIEHPHVVRVYETGRTPHGKLYMVMEYLDGRDLAGEFGGKPQEVKDAAGLVRLLAETIHQVHQSGIIHRDLKLKNVLVSCEVATRICDKESIKITDFDVAKLLSDDATVTEGVAFLGTPTYMAPEQASGNSQKIGPWTDVYGLGTILYELVTGRPPYIGQNSEDARRQVLEEEPLPPRRLNPQVPRDLETICLKCLQKEPRWRYATAQELADDLRRFLTGASIHARPVRLAERGWRWCRRNPVVAGLAAAVVLVLVGGLVTTTWQWQRAERHLTAAEFQREQAAHERRRAEANLHKAQDAVDFIGQRIGGLRLADMPHAEEVRREILEYALRFHQDFVSTNSEDPSVRWEAGKAHVRAGVLHNLLGQSNEAEGAFRTGASLIQELPVDFPSRLENRRMLLQAYTQLGVLLAELAKFKDSEQAFLEAEKLLKELSAEPGIEQEYRGLLAGFHHNRATRFNKEKRYEDAEASARQAVVIYRQLAEQFPDEWQRHHELAVASNSLAIALKRTKRLVEAKEAYQETRETQQKLAARFPNDRELQCRLATTCRNLGILLKDASEPAEARAAFAQAEAIFSQLASDYPRTPLYRTELGETYYSWAGMSCGRSELAEARDLLEKAAGQWQVARKIDPRHPGHRYGLCKSYHDLASVLIQMGDHRRASQAAVSMGAVSREAIDYFLAPRLLIDCMKVADRDGQLAEEQRGILQREYAGQATAILREAYQQGKIDAQHLRTNTGLDLLRTHEDFKTLLGEIGQQSRQR